MSTPIGTPPAFSPFQYNPDPAPQNDTGNDGVTIRPMRLKVLYTFDDQNKTNCLARWPHVLEIQTVAMDETTSIGVVELKTCINAIIQCSPELVNRLGHDYTVYAYDYSEYDNPLVGQGMLSRALASASPTPDAPALQSRQLITGRVCKNILGIFSNGVKETLEVKLRLVPVPTVLQGEYLDAMEKYRELSKGLPPNFDPNEWNTFLQSNPNLGQMANKTAAVNAPTPSTHQRDGMSMEVVNQLLIPSLPPTPALDPFSQTSNAENSGNEGRASASEVKGTKTSRPSSRATVKRPRSKKPKAMGTAGGNTSGYEEGTDGDDGPAPKKRAKVTKATDWKNNSNLGTNSDSLRVAASTAGSLRLFRPIAMAPNAPLAPKNHLQDIPRAPTPVPIQPNQHLARDRPPAQSGLRRDSFATQLAGPPRQHTSPYPPLQPSQDQLKNSIESNNPSPERSYSPVGTLPDIGSSPPVMRTRPASPMRSSPPCASSPVLPQMPRTDSGFMSGSLDDLFGEDDETIRPIEDDEVEIVRYERARPSEPAPSPAEPEFEFVMQHVMPGPVELLPTRMPYNEQAGLAHEKAVSAVIRAGSVMSEDGQTLPPLKKNRSGSRTTSMSQSQKPQSQPTPLSQAPVQANSPPVQIPEAIQDKAAPQPAETLPPLQAPPLAPTSNSRPASRTMARTASMGSLTLPTPPQVPASDPVLPPSTLQRSQTWSEAPHPATDAPMQPYPGPPYYPNMPMNQMQPINGIPYSRTMMAKKAAIQQKLEEAIAKGKMPPFCSNCGAITTPTWRKAWSQECQGEPGYHDYSDEPGRVTAINILTRNPDGKPTSYQLIKKFLGPQENQGNFKEFLLCNPCGIWMSKYKTQRPKERWESGSNRQGDKKKGNQRSKAKNQQQQNFLVPTSEANYPQSEAYFPQSEAAFPQSEAIMQPEGVSPADTTAVAQQGEQGVQAANQARRSGSGRPRPEKRLKAMTSDAASAALRRAIQSSPARWAGTAHSPIDLEEDDLGSTRRLLFPSPRKDGSPKVLGEVVANVVTIATEFRSPKESMVEMADKENCPPAIDIGDEDSELMRLFDEEMTKGEAPRPSTPTQKTPPQNPFKTPTRPTPSHRPITRSVSRSIRSGKSPGQGLLFHGTPTRTPRRSPRNHEHVFDSPFTATLNQMMSEANNQTSPMRNTEYDFGTLPDLPNIEHDSHVDINFNLEDFFSTDVPMPSSPPSRAFHLYEDPLTMGNISWEEFRRFEKEHDSMIKKEPESPDKTKGKERELMQSATEKS